METHTTVNTLVVPLTDLVDAGHAGEKAFRLARMHRLGLPVPDGVVVTTAAFNAAVCVPPIRDLIDAKVAALTLDNPRAMAVAADEIMALVTNIELSRELTDTLGGEAERLLAEGPVVVRSSARGEDSAAAACAGQLDSFLQIRALDETFLAVRRCWASYWSHRSLAYQLARGIALHGMGVIVQRQVDARFSGVLFTRDSNDAPGHDRGFMVMEYGSGLGDTLVSGAVTPKRLRISWDAIDRSDPTDGTARASTDSPDDAEPTLDAAVVGQLARLGRRLERELDAPQDIEWAVDRENGVHVVQSRPITAPIRKSSRVIWSNANVNENFPEPVCPLLYSIAATGYYHYFRNLGKAFGIAEHRITSMEYPLRGIIGTHGGRIYYNLTHIHAVLRAVPSGEFLADAFNQFVGTETTDTSRDDAHSPADQRRAVRVREFARFTWRVWRCFRSLESRVKRFESTIDAFAADSHPDSLPRRSRSELLGLWHGFMEIRCRWTDAALADAASMISYGLARRFMAAEFTADGEQAIVNRLLTGLCNIVSGVPTERLWELSRLVRRDVRLKRMLDERPSDEVWRRILLDDTHEPVRNALRVFLETWGFRCSGELMLTQPSYQENPPALLDMLRAFIHQDGDSPRELLRKQDLQRQRETARVMSVLSQRAVSRFLPWPRKDWIANRLIRWTQHSVACRERARFKQALLYSRCRRLALAIGNQFHGRRLLAQPEDVFFLTFNEIESLLVGDAMFHRETARLARMRRDAHEPLAALRPPDRLEMDQGDFWPEDAVEPTRHREATPGNNAAHSANAPDAATAPTAPGVMRGQGVCGGAVVGRAVVLTDPAQFERVSVGDILVTRQTDPGWGPILFLVRGLVMERGGMLSHGAILAREFGIPTVVDIGDATSRVVTGDTIQVDGDRGTVEILDR